MPYHLATAQEVIGLNQNLIFHEMQAFVQWGMSQTPGYKTRQMVGHLTGDAICGLPVRKQRK